MNNVDKLAELRRIAIARGFPKETDQQFYIPVRSRLDGRSYISNNSDQMLLFDPQWVESLVGDEPTKPGWVDGITLEEIELPKYKATMMYMVALRADRGDVIGFLYDMVKRADEV